MPKRKTAEELASELARMRVTALRSGFALLAYILDMARMEAEEIGKPPSPNGHD